MTQHTWLTIMNTSSHRVALATPDQVAALDAVLAHVPDTLIERKFGDRAAARVREEARPIESSLMQCHAPGAMTAPLLALDQALKTRGLNPGTSADLTVATVFASSLIALEGAK